MRINQSGLNSTIPGQGDSRPVYRHEKRGNRRNPDSTSPLRTPRFNVANEFIWFADCNHLLMSFGVRRFIGGAQIQWERWPQAIGYPLLMSALSRRKGAGGMPEIWSPCSSPLPLFHREGGGPEKRVSCPKSPCKEEVGGLERGCPVWWPQTPCGYRAPERQLVWIKTYNYKTYIEFWRRNMKKECNTSH